MQPSLNTWTVLLLFATAQGLFLALVLFTQQRGNRRANRVLAWPLYIQGFVLTSPHEASCETGAIHQFEPNKIELAF
jgi:hypothetical protein